jgi:hypothetical protein
MDKDSQMPASFLCWEEAAAWETGGDVVNIMKTEDEIEKHRMGKVNF